MPSLKQRCSSLCTLDCKGLRVQQEHFHTQYPRAVSVQRLEHPLGEKEGLRGGGEGGRGRGREKEVHRGEQRREQWPEDPCREKEKCGGRGGGVMLWWWEGCQGSGEPKEPEWEDREIERGEMRREEGWEWGRGRGREWKGETMTSRGWLGTHPCRQRLP